jgi:hypothetical protein
MEKKGMKFRAHFRIFQCGPRFEKVATPALTCVSNIVEYTVQGKLHFLKMTETLAELVMSEEKSRRIL